MPTFYGVPSDGSGVPEQLAVELAVDLDDPTSVLGAGAESDRLRAQARALAAKLAAKRRPRGVTDDVPTTATVTLTEAITSGIMVDFPTMTTHPVGNSNGTYYRTDGGLAPLEFILDGSELEITFTAANGYAPHTQVWVDDEPIAADPIHNAAITTNAEVYLHLVWPTSRVRRVRVVNYGGALRFIRTPDHTHQLYPVMGKPVLGIFTDSFGGQTNYSTNYEAFPSVIEDALNVNFVRSTYGGSGYLTGGSAGREYDHDMRVAEMTRAVDMSAIVFWGTINDPIDGDPEVFRARVRSTWDKLAAARPGIPFVVCGVETANASGLAQPGRHRNNRIMYEEAEEHPAVVGFIDMLGTAQYSDATTGTVPPAWESGTAYPQGSLITWNGAIYKALPDVGAASGQTPVNANNVWGRVSWVFTGTGHSGAVAGDGNRDVLLGADGVHPTAKGNAAFGLLMAEALLGVLSNGERFTYWNV